jgi:enoyl-CoA hydratase
MTGRLSVEVVGGTAVVQLCNPARRNALSMAMWQALIGFAEHAAHSPDLRVVVIRGDGTAAFSAGADISEFDAARDGSSASGYDDLVETACRKIEAMAQPTIAAISGCCIGAGLSLAASCDLRLADAAAFFAVPAARLGLGYDPRGIARLLRVLGPQSTRFLLYTGGRLSAADAGGAVQVVRPEAVTVFDTALELARVVASNAPLTVKAAKSAIRALELADDAALAEAHALAARADRSADYVEGRAAFAARRPPRFTGA